MKTAKKMGIRTVAVYSDADENSMHVDMVSLKLNLKKKSVVARMLFEKSSIFHFFRQMKLSILELQPQGKVI